MMAKLKLKNTLFIIIGAAIFSFGIVHFNMQNNLGEGGFSGITLLFYFLWDWNPAISSLVLNIPLFFIGWKLLGKTTFYYTIIGTVFVSIFLAIFQIKPFQLTLKSDMTLAALFSGVFIGVGLGIVFRNGGTTGGVDIIARIVNKYIGWSMGKTMFLFDTLVITISIIFYLNMIEGMYTLVLIYIAARVIDFIQEGAYSARGVTIISKHHKYIADKIIAEMGRGVTILNGKGHFTGEQQHVIYCIVAKNEIIRLKSLMLEVDPYAFASVSTVHEVMGEGFTLDRDKQPLNM